MMSILKSIKDKIASFWKISDEVARFKAVHIIEHEVEELENIFNTTGRFNLMSSAL